jgi:hypothetical protein
MSLLSENKCKRKSVRVQELISVNISLRKKKLQPEIMLRSSMYVSQMPTK